MAYVTMISEKIIFIFLKSRFVKLFLQLKSKFRYIARLCQKWMPEGLWPGWLYTLTNSRSLINIDSYELWHNITVYLNNILFLKIIIRKRILHLIPFVLAEHISKKGEKKTNRRETIVLVKNMYTCKRSCFSF